MQILETLINSIYETPLCDIINNIILFFIFVIIIAFGIIIVSDNNTKNNILHNIAGGYKIQRYRGGSEDAREDNIYNNIDFANAFESNAYKPKTGGNKQVIYKYYINEVEDVNKNIFKNRVIEVI